MRRLFASTVITLAPGVTLGAVVVLLAAFAPAEVVGAVGIATAVAAPFLVATGNNLRVLSIAGAGPPIAPATRARARFVSWLALGIIGAGWLLATGLTDRALLMAAALLCWRGGDLGWDELALRRELASGPGAAAALVLTRHGVLAIVALCVALASPHWLPVLLAVLVIYWTAGGGQLSRWMRGGPAWYRLLTDRGLQRAAALSIAGIIAALGVFTLRNALARGADEAEVGRYFALTGPISLIGVTASGAALYGLRRHQEGWSQWQRLAVAALVAALAASACLIVGTQELPRALNAGALGEVWPVIPAVAGTIAVLTGATVLAALQEPWIVRSGRERHAVIGEGVLLVLLIVVLGSGAIAMTWQALLTATAGWTFARAALRTSLAGGGPT